MRDKKVLYITQAAVIAALYVVLTVLFAPISFKEVQVRISEMLTVLPFFTPAAVPGLFVGCIIANMLGGAIPLDIVCGSLATLAGACGTWMIGKAARKRNADGSRVSALTRTVSTLPPVIANIIVVPLVLYYGYGVNLPIPLQMVTVGIGEVVSCTLLGGILMTVLEKYRNHIFRTANIEG
jgi:uncharacterized membrane protein